MRRRKGEKELESLIEFKAFKTSRPWIKIGGFINEGLIDSGFHFVTRVLKKLASPIGKQ
jgi:hypothetical protein